MTDELDMIERPEIVLNTSVCRRCVQAARAASGERQTKSLPIDIAHWEGTAVRCPSGMRAPLGRPAPPECPYAVEHAVLNGEALPMPVEKEG
jgi:hypothetical protein